ncbi:MAG: hypothetical protein L6Q84_26300 [Polyangiaceae bacterium]|nr:hypothetical protein [Polyangiaceae bacterium]
MGARRRRIPRKLAALLRLIPLLALLELSGIAHAAADFFEVVVASGHHDSDCDDEQGGRPCDPGCPGCHCTHGGPTVPSAALQTDVPAHMTGVLESCPPQALCAPSPARAPPFRPPRYA